MTGEAPVLLLGERMTCLPPQWEALVIRCRDSAVVAIRTNLGSDLKFTLLKLTDVEQSSLIVSAFHSKRTG